MHAISATQLNAALAGPDAPLLVDVRRRAAREASGLQVPGTVWRDPALWLDWKDEVAQRSPLVLYCAHGQEISQGLAAAMVRRSSAPPRPKKCWYGSHRRYAAPASFTKVSWIMYVASTIALSALSRPSSRTSRAMVTRSAGEKVI